MDGDQNCHRLGPRLNGLTFFRQKRNEDEPLGEEGYWLIATPLKEAMPTGSEVAARDRSPKASIEKTEMRPPLPSEAVKIAASHLPSLETVTSVGVPGTETDL